MTSLKKGLIFISLFLITACVPEIVVPKAAPVSLPPSATPDILSPTPFQPATQVEISDNLAAPTNIPLDALSPTVSISPGTETTVTLTMLPTLSSTPFPVASPTQTQTLVVTSTFTPRVVNSPTNTAVPALPTRTFTPLPPTNTPLPLTKTLPPPTNTSSVCAPSTNAGYESQVISLINDERAAQGLLPLSAQAQLGAAARVLSMDMACNDFMSHSGSDGSTMISRITDQGYSYSALAENVAAGYSSPADVVAGWLGSSGHRANMLNPSLTQIGVAYAYRAGTTYGVYWTADFGAP